jgi:hypothetical protein
MERFIKYWIANEEIGTSNVTIYGKSVVFSYPCKTHECTNYEAIIQPGIYILETWGAQGGYGGGLGGYSRGVIEVKRAKNLYIFVGSKGTTIDKKFGSTPAAFNGGARGFSAHSSSNGGRSAGSGGGGTDIRTNGNSTNNRIIVAGGGGGSSFYQNIRKGGSGGGSSGVSVTNPNAQGATQNSPGIGTNPIGSSNVGTCSGDFGVGGYSSRSNTFGGGGGGWYGGSSGEAGDGVGAGAGGSGYVLTDASYKPSGFEYSDNNFLSFTILIDGDSFMPVCERKYSENHSVKGRTGNGCVRITLHSNLNYAITYNCDDSHSFLFYFSVFLISC